MTIDSSFPGGNILVDRMDEGSASIRPDLRDIEGEWFYWCFRVSDAPVGPVHFHFGQDNVLGSRGPACSEDGGAAWRWLGTDCVSGNSFIHRFPKTSAPVYFSVGIPYTGSHWAGFLGSVSHRFERDVLCRTRKGRPVEILRFGCMSGEPGHRIILTCRHHACEAMASYVVEGLVSYAFDHARRFSDIEFLVAPFMDTDGVEDGDQGKNRRPRDHSRDYAGVSLYPETAALRRRTSGWSKGKLRVAFDFHCPWLKGGINETIYMVGSASPAIAVQQDAFLKILRATQPACVDLRASDVLPFGVDWNVKENFSAGVSAAQWFGEIPGVALSSTWEIPYASADGADISPDKARIFGADLGRALADYLDTLPHEGEAELANRAL